MSERQSEQDPAEEGAARPEPSSTPPIEPVGSPRGSSRAALWLAGLLILILAAVVLSPFWAPQIAPLLPWGDNRAEDASLATRVAALETHPVSASNNIDAVKSATTALARRVRADRDRARHPARPNRETPGIPKRRHRYRQLGAKRAGAPRRSPRGRSQCGSPDRRCRCRGAGGNAAA